MKLLAEVLRAKPKLNGDHNQCPTCSAYFRSIQAFDMHRTGEYGQRQCMTPNEMVAMGMGINNHGMWITKLIAGAVLDGVRHEEASFV
jgi:hypothetical protein